MGIDSRSHPSGVSGAGFRYLSNSSMMSSYGKAAKHGCSLKAFYHVFAGLSMKFLENDCTEQHCVL